MTGAGNELLVLGAINQDEVARVRRHPNTGETVLTDSIDSFQGGKGANQAYAAGAAGLGASVRVIAAIGTDDAGTSALDSLKSVGVDVSLVRTVVGVSTGRAHITVSDDGQNSIVVGLGANAFVSPSLLPADISAAVVVAQTEVGSASVEALARLAATAGARFILNDGPVVALSRATLSAADPLIVNEFEAVDLLGNPLCPADELAVRLLEAFGSQSVIVTLGGLGCVIADGDGVRKHATVAATRVVDTTGAGDSFIGTFAAAVAAGESNDDAISRGAEAAAEAVSWHGARTPPSRSLTSDIVTHAGVDL